VRFQRQKHPDRWPILRTNWWVAKHSAADVLFHNHTQIRQIQGQVSNRLLPLKVQRA
jgi:hypothetical protein